MPTDADIQLLLEARHGDPFAVLGLHQTAEGWQLVTLQPGAAAVAVIDASTGATRASLARIHADGVFAGCVNTMGRFGYRLWVTWCDGSQSIVDDPYRFPPVIGEMDAWLLGEGSHLRPYEVLGANPCLMDNVPGTAFAVWAPNASRVSVVGEFNRWDGRRNPMRLRRECGVWELFVPGVGVGTRYKYEVTSRAGELLPLKADPYARACELRPATASVVTRMPSVVPPSAERRHANALDAPMTVYEVHLGSWRRKADQGNRWLTWDELADTLIGYTADMGFTHLELLPVSEHPFDGSWGYQPTGLFAPTARFSAPSTADTRFSAPSSEGTRFSAPSSEGARGGDPAGFRRFVNRVHAAGLGVIVDWVPAHFPSDAHGLANFDGTHLYEYADPREGWHQDWDTLIYNFGRTEVRNFLVGNALYWLERYGIDGLRVDAVASMLYRDYSREPGQWVPNVHGGRENLEAIDFLQRMNQVVCRERPQAVTLAEESTAYPAVSRPTYSGGLGFHFKWNMGWMHDTLAYMRRDPIHRRYHHDEMTFSLIYAFNENFVLPLSHDEVVHGKGSLLGRMPGDRWQKFANLRAYYGFMYAHPGKKLLFMGAEFAQEREWNHDASLDWHLLDDPMHSGVQRLVRDLNQLVKATPALHEVDFDAHGFEWIDHGDDTRSVLSFIRRSHKGESFIVAVSNFTPTVHEGYRIGVPQPGLYRERLNTDSMYYGGSNVGTPLGAAQSEARPWHSHPQSIALTLPPLATIMLEWTA